MGGQWDMGILRPTLLPRRPTRRCASGTSSPAPASRRSLGTRHTSRQCPGCPAGRTSSCQVGGGQGGGIFKITHHDGVILASFYVVARRYLGTIYSTPFPPLLPQPPGTRRSSCGTWRPASPSSPSRAITPRSTASPSRPTGTALSAVLRTSSSRSGASAHCETRPSHSFN